MTVNNGCGEVQLSLFQNSERTHPDWMTKSLSVSTRREVKLGPEFGPVARPKGSKNTVLFLCTPLKAKGLQALPLAS
jgi:hypothetical protein